MRCGERGRSAVDEDHGHFGPTHLPIYAVLGNHDYGDQQQRGGPDYWTCGHPDPQAEVKATETIAKWEMPARNYTMHSPLADFVMVDTQPLALDFPKGYDSSLGADGENAWIAGAVPRMRAHWRIVVCHHTIFFLRDARAHEQRHADARPRTPRSQSRRASAAPCWRSTRHRVKSERKAKK